MASWIKKASSFIDSIDQVANQQINKDGNDEEDTTTEEHQNDDNTNEEMTTIEEGEDENESTKHSEDDETESTTQNTKSNELSSNDTDIQINEAGTNIKSPKHSDQNQKKNKKQTQSPQNSVKPKKKSKKKSKKANKSSSNTDSDYLQLKKQYEGMVKLWNEERANLKKAQQLLRSQKESFKTQTNNLESEHISKINDVSQQFQDQINAKNSTIESLEASLLSIKEDRNNKIENDQDLQNKIKELESEKYQILKEKSQMSLDKQKQIESIRNEFDLERKDWEKERSILTKNFERESFLENENVEYTNALARIQSNLQQRELENARLRGELNWIKRDKEELDKTNVILKEENESSQEQIDSLQQVINDKNRQIICLKQEQNDFTHSLQAKINKLQNENDRMTEELNKESMLEITKNYQSESDKMNQRIRSLTNALLEKQTDIDMLTSKKNEYRIKLSKMEDANKHKNEIENHLIKRSITPLSTGRRGKNGSDLMRKRNFTSYKSLDYGISVFDRIGVELGRVMRNKPWLRVLIVFYIIALHLWCFIVLHFSMNFGEDDTHYRNPGP